MEVKEALQARRSIRKFTDEKITKEEIDELMHAAMSGPSAVNRTPWEFYVVTDKQKLEQLKGASRYTKMDAPLAIIVCGNKLRMLPLKMSEFWVQDCSAATENILLRAVDMGLGSVWCGIYPQKDAAKNVAEILDLPNRHVPLNIIYIGHPAETRDPRDQYKEEYVHIVD